MEDQTRPRNQLTPALGAIVLLVGGAWIASQGGLIAPDVVADEAHGKFFGAWFQLVSSLPVLICMWIGAVGLGAPFRLWLVPHAKHWLIIQIASGWGVLLMLDWLAAWFGLLNGWSAWGFCGLGLAVWTYHFADPEQRQRWHPDNWPSPPWTLLLGLPALGLMLIVCSCPPGTLWGMEGFAYDVTNYHLQVPREWMANGGMTSLTHNAYSYLPLFNEVGYMQAAEMADSMYASIYTTQYLHASMALFAAVAIAKLVSSFAGPAAGVFGGVCLLVMPWTVITGSLAYNEMFVIAFGASALLIVFDGQSQTKGGAAMLGILLGCMVLSKLTAGAMIALPIGIMILLRDRLHNHSTKSAEVDAQASVQAEANADSGNTVNRKAKPVTMLGFVVLVAVLTVSPYLIRNTLWTGNPVFPFATSVFGTGHWDQDNADRWHAAHESRGVGAGLSDLPRQWLMNTGYGAVLGQKIDDLQGTDVARFETEYGIPLFWLLAFIGCMLGIRRKESQALAVGMLIMLGCQLLFWLLGTHHQSRFLVSTLLPGCVWMGLLFHGCETYGRERWRSGVHDLIFSGIAFVFTSTLFAVAWSQSRIDVHPDGDKFFRPPVAYWVDTLIDPNDVTVNQPGRRMGNHPLNAPIKTNADLNVVSQPNRVLLIPGGGQLLYIRRPIEYCTPFDRNLLGELIGRHGADPAAISIALHQRGITHVWVNPGELNRIANSFGLDKRLTPGNLQLLTKAWYRVDGNQMGRTVLFDIRPAVAAVWRMQLETESQTPATKDDNAKQGEPNAKAKEK